MKTLPTRSHPLRPGPFARGLACLLAVLGLAASAPAASPRAVVDGKPAHAHRVLVKYREAAPDAARIVRQEGLKIRRQPSLVNRLAVLELDEPQPATLAADEAELSRRLNGKLDALRRSGQFEYVEPDWQVSMGRVPTDTAFTQGTLWGLRNNAVTGADIGAAAAWDITTGSRDVVVAVIDTGIRHTHQDLAAQMWENPGEIAGNGLDDDGDGYVDNVHGINAITGYGEPFDDNDHGTHVAGTIGASANGSGPHVGVAWQVRLMACKFLSAEGSGYHSDAIECIQFAVRNGASVLNNSWGGGGYSQALYDAILAARNAGVLFVAAAGNEGTDNDATPHYPSSYSLDNVIAVAATTRSDSLASFSCFGRTSVDLGAPGENIYSSTAASDTSYASFSGTSMATPHVSGVAALVRAQFPNISLPELRARLLNSAVPIPALSGRCVTGGRVHAYRALTGSTNTPPPPPPPPATVANDHFASAHVLTGPAGSSTGSNVGATRETGEPYHWGTTGGKSVWYRWTAPATGWWEFETAGSSFDTVLAVYTGSSVGGLTRVAANDDDGSLQSRVEFFVQAGVTYAIAVDGYNAANGSIVLRWASSDSVPPTVAFLTPAAGARLLAPTTTLSGTAGDNLGVARVEYRVNGGAWQTASGTTRWTANVTLPIGFNTVQVRSVDAAGNGSSILTRSFTQVPAGRLTVRVEGAGSVTPNLDQRWIELGKPCTLTATPAAGHLFSQWSGDVAAATPRLNFVVNGDTEVEAHFVPDPYPAWMGAYSGLFHAGDDILHETAGSFTAQVNGRGFYTGSLLWRGQRMAMSGRFSLDGRATNVVSPVNLPGIRLELALENTGRLVGRLGLSYAVATLAAHRAGFDAVSRPCPWQGRYTLAVAGHTNATDCPGGHGTAVVTVDAAGRVTMTGTLGDGTPVTQSARLSAEGWWPKHLVLYQGRGSMLGWMRFENAPDAAVTGPLTWTKPPVTLPSAYPYPTGFRLVTGAAGSRYALPVLGEALLRMTNAVLTLTGGGLVEDLRNPVLLGADNRVFNLGSLAMNLTFVPQTGLFRGSFTHPGTSRIVSFTGVALQRANLAVGAFRNGAVSGAIVMTAGETAR